MSSTTKEQILGVSMEVFAEHGYDGATTREISKRAGVNIAAIKYHWGSKEKLWIAACHRAATDLAGAVNQSLDLTLPPAELVTNLLEALFDELVRNPRPVRIATWAMLQAASIDVSGTSNQFKILFDLGLSYYRHLRNQGQVRELDIEMFLVTFYADFVVALVDRAGHRELFGKDVTDPEHGERVRRFLIDSVLLRLGLLPSGG